MKINPDTRIATLETNAKPCHRCFGRGEVPTYDPCPTNGNGPRGGLNGCKTCRGSKSHTNWDVKEVCPSCEGDNPMHATDETLYDFARYSQFRNLVEWVVRDDTNMAFTKIGTLIGSGLGHTVDYGNHTRLTDEELIAKERDRDTTTQWVKIVRKDDMRLADRIVITRLANGYAMQAEWK